MQKYDGETQGVYQNLQVDDETRLKAQQEISEDGFGVSNKLLNGRLIMPKSVGWRRSVKSRTAEEQHRRGV